MDVFLSWSGNRSKQMAEALREWLPHVIQALNPWMSKHNIAAGAQWHSELAEKLQDINFGIFCLTSDNLNAPWLLYEAGALAKNTKDGRVCTFLLDINPTEVEFPLAAFQHTEALNKEAVFHLMKSINDTLKETLEKSVSEHILTSSFNRLWPDLETKLKAILPPQSAPSPKRPQEDKINEILITVRQLVQQVTFLPSAINPFRWHTLFEAVPMKGSVPYVGSSPHKGMSADRDIIPTLLHNDMDDQKKKDG